MKWSVMVIGVLLCLMPMAFAQQPEVTADIIMENLPGIIGGGVVGSGLGGILSGGLGGILSAVGSIIGGCLAAGLNAPFLGLIGCVDLIQAISYWIGDIYLYLAATFWDLFLFVGGDICLAGCVDLLQSASYWIGDICLMCMALCGMIWDYSILNELTAFSGDVITWFAGIPTAGGLDCLEGILETLCFINPLGVLGSTAWAVGSSCLLGTLSGYLGLFLLYGPFALCCWPVAGGIALIEGGISAVANIIFGAIFGTLASVLSGCVLLSAEIFPPLKWFGARPMIWALGVGGIGGIVGAIAGALLGAILGFCSGLAPLTCCCIPGAFNGALLGAVSGLIDGFGTGFIAAGWH